VGKKQTILNQVEQFSVTVLYSKKCAEQSKSVLRQSALKKFTSGGQVWLPT
jgi:hypothetical protein